MKALLLAAGIVLIAYINTVLWVEWQYGQAAVRYFVSDIQCVKPAGNIEVPSNRLWLALYGVNTFLTSVLLWSSALLFIISFVLTRLQPVSRRWFYLSQIGMFTYLSLDERFMLHETFGRLLEMNDAYLLLGLGLLQVGLLLSLAQLTTLKRAAWLFLGGAALFFSVMIGIDAVLPSHWTLRLSLEDLTKLLGACSLVGFAGVMLSHELSQLTEKSKA